MLRVSKCQTRGFSLVEALVSFAMVAILAAIIAAAVGRVQEWKTDARCVNNLRQLTVGAFNYMADRNMEYPVHYLNATSVKEQWYLPLSARTGPGQNGQYPTAYVPHAGYGRKKEPYFCMGNPAFSPEGQLAWTNYAMNSLLSGKKAPTIETPKVFFLDGNYSSGKKLWYLYPGLTKDDWGKLLPTHGQYSNFAFTDGRVERVKIPYTSPNSTPVPMEWFTP